VLVQGLEMKAAPMSPAAIEERFVLLETKIAYYEKTNLDLSDVIIAQGRELDSLKQRLEALERQLRGLDEGEAVPHERPPHY
jgi:uncharacterized coiled-coil protein SlyX